MPKLTNEQLAVIHSARKVGVTKGSLFRTEVERKRIEREGGMEFMGEFVPSDSPGKLPFPTYVKMVREKEKRLGKVFPKKSKIIADKMIMEEMLIRNPELKSEFLKQPRITEQELERMR